MPEEPMLVTTLASSTAASPALPPSRRRLGLSLAVAVVLMLAAVAALAVVRSPAWTLAGGLVLAAVALAAARLPLAVAILVASFYFDAYITAAGVGVVTVGKLLGVLALGAWFLAWGLGRRRSVAVHLLWPLAGLAVWLPLTLAVAYDQAAGLTVGLRYLTFFALVFLVVQTVDGDRRAAVRIVDVAVLAATAAALVGLGNFLAHGGRARGPLDDPNDFAFLLAVTLPLALYRVRSAPDRLRRTLAVLAVAALAAGILATLSRSAIAGLAVAAVWATVTGRLPLRWTALLVGGALAIALGWYAVQPQQIETALLAKQHVAQSNINERQLAWQVALREARSSPLLGVGPGNFELRFDEFSPPVGTGQGTLATHNAYLSVLAELGVPGLSLFLVYLALSWSALRRRWGDPDADALQAALAGGFIVAVVGALFLTEQFYAPLWLLPAIGATLARRGQAGGGRGEQPP
jgi:putative inorganic carbon (hco3(-)) transporter